MNYYLKKFEKLQEDFHEVIHDYPLFKEIIDNIYDKDIKEIEDLVNKNDEYYLKKAIDKLERLINYIKDTSTKITLEYKKFDKLVSEWNKQEFIDYSNEELDKINDKINKCNELIKSHDIKDIMEANNILEKLIKDCK